MSLVVSNRATDKQLEALKGMGYLGTLDLTVTEAAKLLDELFEEVKYGRERERWGIEFEGQILDIY